MSASSTLWLISAHTQKRGGNSPGRMLAQVEVTATTPPRQRRAGGGITGERARRKYLPSTPPASESSDKQGAAPTSSGPDKNNSAQEQDEVRKKMVQRPVYFVSSLLQGARSRYSGVQKLLFGLLMASRKLRHYFQAHEIRWSLAFR